MEVGGREEPTTDLLTLSTSTREESLPSAEPRVDGSANPPDHGTAPGAWEKGRCKGRRRRDTNTERTNSETQNLSDRLTMGLVLINKHEAFNRLPSHASQSPQ